MSLPDIARRIPFALRSVFAGAVVAVCSSACGGGQSAIGPSGAPTSPTVTPAQQASTLGAGPLSHAVERTSAQSALSALRPLVYGVTRLDYGVMQLASARKPSAASTWLRSHTDLAACTAGNTSSSVSQRSPDGVQNRTTTTFTDHIYYDGACSQLWRTDTGIISTTVDMNDNDVNYSSIVGTETVRSASGRMIEVDQVSAGSDIPDAVTASYTLSVTASASNTGASDSFFVDCAYTQCHFGDIENLATTDILPAVGVYVIDRPDSPNSESYTGIDAFAVAGARSSTVFGGLGIAGQSRTQSLQERRITSRDAAGNVSIAITMLDEGSDVASTGTFDAKTITGTVQQASDSFPVAKFAVDVNGYGNIQYADGTQGTIEGFGIAN